MSERIVECVPNFSEGRDQSVIDRIAAAMAGIDGARVLDVDPGKATNRTVITAVGTPEAMLESAWQGIATATALIDMRRHAGEHARIGATDVCPFVPVRGVTMVECAELARRLGERVGKDLHLPVFLYEAAASAPARKNLADIRAGEYEGLARKLEDPAWKPDYGPAEFNARSGATVIGARPFLIAYNVNLNTRSKKLASEIALEIREQGRQARGPDGRPLKGPDGRPVLRPGRLRAVKAVGWFIEEYARAQVSVNLTDHETTSLHDVFDAVDEEARKLGLRATGSELVGLVPLEAMLRAGRHYLRRQGRSRGLPEAQVVETAVQTLGLSELTPFDPAQRIIEYRLRAANSLAGRTVRGFVDELSSESPAPGGGSVAALCGSLAAGLCAMVANLTVGRKGSDDRWADCDAAAVAAQDLKDGLLRAIDEDTEAFNGLMAANRLPKGTPEQAAARATALCLATRRAVLVPASVLERAAGIVALAERMLEIGNPNAASDAATAAACALASAEGAYFNVVTNLRTLEGDEEWARTTRSRADDFLAGIRARAPSVARRFLSGPGG